VKAGFSRAARHLSARNTVADAVAWIDAHVARLGAETVALADAAGRVLAQDVVAAAELPPFDRAEVDGVAVRADETAGASAYNPLSFHSVVDGKALSASAGMLLSAGDPLPAWADAVIAIEHVQPDAAGTCEIIEAVAAGSGIEPRGAHFILGSKLIETGRRLHPHAIGLLAAAGISRVAVTRRPRVHCSVLTPTTGALGVSLHDANGPLLRALSERDGGIVAELRQIARDRASIARALAAADADVVIVAGGTGQGSRDEAAAAVADVGELAIHGVALHPGESAGLGRNGAGVPVVLLPGAPAACLWAYEFFAGRAIRRLAGCNPALPFRLCEMTTARKIVSAIGMTEICPVRRLDNERVEPLASAATAGIAAIAQADGFVIVAEGSEGFAAGALVPVHLRQEADRAPSYRETERKP
jgi:molybdopterin molybdotransferase